MPNVNSNELIAMDFAASIGFDWWHTESAAREAIRVAVKRAAEKGIDICGNDLELDWLRIINNRQLKNDFTVNGIPDNYIKEFKKKKYMSYSNIVTKEGWDFITQSILKKLKL